MSIGMYLLLYMYVYETCHKKWFSLIFLHKLLNIRALNSTKLQDYARINLMYYCKHIFSNKKLMDKNLTPRHLWNRLCK